MGSLNAEPLLSLEALADGALAEAGAVLGGDAESLILYRQGGEVRDGQVWLAPTAHPRTSG